MFEKRTVNFVGNFATGYVGEVADETHLAREIARLGHTVRRIPRDEWREHVLDDKVYPNIPKDLKADINIVCKWHHFYDSRFIEELRKRSNAPVFYWVWDYMADGGLPEWHTEAIQASDLYLGNDVLAEAYQNYPNSYYFPFDVADGNLDRYLEFNKEYDYDVAFFGSYLKNGNRVEFLKKINEEYPVKIFSWNHEEWDKEGFDASPAVYGNDFNRMCTRTKINLGFSVEPYCWGYWSNRVGKTLLAGGFLLYEYAPGMELFLRDGIEYFSTPDEAIEKIRYYLFNDEVREKIRRKGMKIGKDRFSSKERIKDLMLLVDRFLEDPTGKVTLWQT